MGNKQGMETMPNIALVPVEGDLDVTTVPRVRDTVDTLISSGCRRVILNMAGVQYVDSAGMALLFREIRSMRQAGGLLSLINVSDRVLRTLRIARVVDFAPISGTNARPEVPELDPTVMPTWRTALRVNATDLQETRGKVEALLRRMPFSDDQVFDITLAIGEAMGNAIDHTDGRDALVTVSAYPDRAVIDVTDRGCGISVRRGQLPAQERPNEERGDAASGGLRHHPQALWRVRHAGAHREAGVAAAPGWGVPWRLCGSPRRATQAKIPNILRLVPAVLRPSRGSSCKQI